MYKSTVELKAT